MIRALIFLILAAFILMSCSDDPDLTSDRRLDDTHGDDSSSSPDVSTVAAEVTEISDTEPEPAARYLICNGAFQDEYNAFTWYRFEDFIKIQGEQLDVISTGGLLSSPQYYQFCDNGGRGGCRDLFGLLDSLEWPGNCRSGCVISELAYELRLVRSFELGTENQTLIMNRDTGTLVISRNGADGEGSCSMIEPSPHHDVSPRSGHEEAEIRSIGETPVADTRWLGGDGITVDYNGHPMLEAYMSRLHSEPGRLVIGGVRCLSVPEGCWLSVQPTINISEAADVSLTVLSDGAVIGRFRAALRGETSVWAPISHEEAVSIATALGRTRSSIEFLVFVDNALVASEIFSVREIDAPNRIFGGFTTALQRGEPIVCHQSGVHPRDC